MKNIPLIKKSLALRLLKVVFSIYLCITVIITLVQMANEYFLEEQFIKDSLIINQQIFQENLVTSVWNFDNEQLVATIHGMLKQPMIVGIEILDENKKFLIKNGQILNENSVPVLLENGKEITFNYLFKHSFNLVHENKTIGNVTLYSSSEVVFNKVKYNFLVIIINAIVKTIVLWLLFIWAFNKFLTQQLDIFCQAMENVDIDNHKNCFLSLETFNTYELSRIEYFFNDLLRRIIDSRVKLNVLNKTLEQKVTERTQQLLEKQNDLEQLNLKLEQQLTIIEQLSITDELTKLYNRRHFNTVFPKEIQRAARKKNTISFLVFDIDYFKQYNDNYGHQKGDEVLRTIGQVLKKYCQRASDIALRLGGEEFGIIFSDLNHEEALMFAEEIRFAIEDAQIEHHFSGAARYITASFGLVTLLANPKVTMDYFYKQADEALYQAKNSGRNRVVVA